MKHYERAWAEISLDAIEKNISEIKRLIKEDTQIICVIKTDGYGHGAVPIARALQADERIWGFAVATAEEAFELRAQKIEKPVLILGYSFPYCYEKMIHADIRPAVYMYDTAKALSDAAVSAGKTCHIHIKVDTGMSRIGIQPDEEGFALLKAITELPAIEIEGIFTHFATADEKDKTKSYRQFEKYQEFVQRAQQELGLQIPLKHVSNSAGIIEMPEANLDAVRAGIILYGLWPSAEVMENGKISLTPALELKSRIVYVKTVPKNQEISYGGIFTTFRDTRVATVCIGYGDGYPRSLSNVGHVLVNGQKAPIIGKVCMDQLMIDVTDVDGEICIGDEVTLIGKSGEEQITMEGLGDLSGRFNYELACDLGKRIPRIYKLDDTLIG